jgi:hypothetical protein
MTTLFYIFLFYVVMTILAIVFARWSNKVVDDDAFPLVVCFIPIFNWFVWMIAVIGLIDYYTTDYLASMAESKISQNFLKWFYAKHK